LTWHLGGATMIGPALVNGEAPERRQLMAIAAVFDVPGGTQEEHDAATRELGPAGESLAGAPGLLFHAAGPTADGWRVIEVWESQEAMNRFMQEQVMPAMQRAGVNRQPSVQVMPVHQYLT
jgi:hypothetical protein